jgi:hypothetical protein
MLFGIGQGLQSNGVTAPSLFLAVLAVLAILRVVFVFPNPAFAV